MYRQGLGDCFLITFDPGGNESHMLIDCGSLGATTTGVKIKDVVDDIHATTGGHLHVLVATHEHQDHVSGFRSQKKAFRENFEVENVWLAWTEDPDDPFSQEIQEYKNDLGMALAGASALLRDSQEEVSQATGEAIESILGFFTESGDEEAPATTRGLGAGGDKFAETIDEAMDFVRTGFGENKTRYFLPGEVETTTVPGFRFYILGPPRDKTKMENLGENGSEELYHLSGGFRAAVSARGGMSVAGGSATDESEMPFDKRYGFKPDDPLVTRHMEAYRDAEQEWRRIDADWLHSASDFALQLDNIINNTSLAIAIERVSDGKVLLFPGDAQEGNWLSWHDPEMIFTVKDGRRKVKKTAADLLDATVFYKVGHHCSHNATAKGKGLELMTKHKELVAFIPVDRAVALGRNPQGSWKMPAKSLYTALLGKCRGRVVRSDTGWADEAANAADLKTEEDLNGIGDDAKWALWKRAQQAADNKVVTIGDSYIDYHLT